MQRHHTKPAAAHTPAQPGVRPPAHSPPALRAEEELSDWRLYAANVRRLMADRLGVPLVEQASCLGVQEQGGARGASAAGTTVAAGTRLAPDACPSTPSPSSRAPQGLEDERQLWRWGVSVNLLGTRLLVPDAARRKDD